MATGLRFHGTVSEEMRELLRREYKEYAAKTAMTDDEHMALRKWVSVSFAVFTISVTVRCSTSSCNHITLLVME